MNYLIQPLNTSVIGVIDLNPQTMNCYLTVLVNPVGPTFTWLQRSPQTPPPVHTSVISQGSNLKESACFFIICLSFHARPLDYILKPTRLYFEIGCMWVVEEGFDWKMPRHWPSRRRKLTSPLNHRFHRCVSWQFRVRLLRDKH